MIYYEDFEEFDKCHSCALLFEDYQTVFMGWSKSFCSKICRDRYYRTHYKKLKL